MATIPCPTCPWRRTSTVGGSDIPGFTIELMRTLANTVGPGDDFRPIMACHGSAVEAETPCIGYVAVEGWTNLAIRMAAKDGHIDINEIDARCEYLDLWSSFDEMLAAYELAIEAE